MDVYEENNAPKSQKLIYIARRSSAVETVFLKKKKAKKTNHHTKKNTKSYGTAGLEGSKRGRRKRQLGFTVLYRAAQELSRVQK